MSTDGGSVWTLLDSFYVDGGALVADPNNNQVFYSGGNRLSGSYYVMAVSKTTNSGGSWTRSYLTSTTGFTYALAVDRNNSNIVYAGGIPSVFKSTNAGASWSASSTGLTGYVYDLRIDPQNSAIVYAASTDGVFKSTNSGTSWTDAGLDSVRAVAINPAAPETIYAGTGTGVYRSGNGGGSWSAYNDGLGNTNVHALAINPGNFIFAGTGEGAYRSSMIVGANENKIPKDAAIPFTARYDFESGCFVVTYAVGTAGGVEFSVYDIRGSLVNRISRNAPESGRYVFAWKAQTPNGIDIPSGVYFCVARFNGGTYSAKTAVLR